jgi:uncharacterized membrane protein YdjX (TVP38/TMEM64 family)
VGTVIAWTGAMPGALALWVIARRLTAHRSDGRRPEV